MHHHLQVIRSRCFSLTRCPRCISAHLWRVSTRLENSEHMIGAIYLGCKCITFDQPVSVMELLQVCPPLSSLILNPGLQGFTARLWPSYSSTFLSNFDFICHFSSGEVFKICTWGRCLFFAPCKIAHLLFVLQFQEMVEYPWFLFISDWIHCDINPENYRLIY